MKYCIVTGADQKYFRVLLGLLDSTAPLNARVIVINLGLTSDQITLLKEREGIEVVVFSYPHDFPGKAAFARDFPGFGAMLARPYLNEIAEDADIIVWMDADTWAQDPSAVLELVNEATAHGLAAIPEVDRNYTKFTFAGRGGWDNELKDYNWFFGAAMAERMRHLPVINSGFWAAQRSSALWSAWQRHLQEALCRIHPSEGAPRLIEQAAFNVAIELEQLAVSRFPVTYNWLVCLSLPAWDIPRQCFVEPSPPHTPIKVIHISGQYMGCLAKLPLIGHDRSKVIRVPTMEYPILSTLRMFRT